MIVDLAPEESPFVEVRRNPLFQRGASEGIVATARIPDGCGARTIIKKLDASHTYTVPAGCDGFIVQTTCPLSGTASTLMPAGLLDGGIYVIPLNGTDYANAPIAGVNWTNAEGFRNALKYSYGATEDHAGYRVVGTGFSCNSLDAPANKKGQHIGGQAEVPAPSCLASTGGFINGSCYGAGRSNYSVPQLIAWIEAQKNPVFSVSQGITVRAHFDSNVYDEFHAPSDVPCYFSGAGWVTHDCKFTGQEGLLSNHYGGFRNFVPTNVTTGVSAGMVFTLKASIICEADVSNVISEAAETSIVPVSSRYEILKWMSNNKDVYPFVTEGHSFWPSFVKTVRGTFRTAVPYVAALAGTGLFGPEAQIASDVYRTVKPKSQSNNESKGKRK